MSLRSDVTPILVTGGCGFLGANLSNALAERGRRVLILDNLTRAGTEENAVWLSTRHRDRIEIERGDIRDPSLVDRLVQQSSAVMHLAAQVAVTTSVTDPRTDFAINATGTLNVLEAVRLRNPEAPVLFASTNKVYGKVLDEGDVERVPSRYQPSNAALRDGVDESAPIDLYSPYGCSKGAADQYVRDYARIYGLRSLVFRMSCIYGPRQFGNEDQGWIAHFLLQALRNRTITIYGDGYQVRDALHVDDAVSAWIRGLDRVDTVKGKILNLGGGPKNAVSLREMMSHIADLRGRAPTVVYDAWRPGDQPWYVSNIAAAQALLDWQPQINLDDGLKSLDGWLCSRFAGAMAASA